MPGHYNMPAIPNRYPLDKNDKLGLVIGALLSGGLAAANSNRSMGENPLLRGLEGGLVGFGAGANQIQDSYSKMLDDYLKGEGMDFRNRQMTQEQQEFQDTLGLNREKFGEEKRRFEEVEKPERLAKTAWYNERAKTITKEKPPKMPDVGNYAKLKAQLAGLRSPQNIDYMGMPAADRAKSIADIENAIRVMERYQPDLIPPQQGAQPATQNAITEEDIQFTAKKYGVSREEVLKRLGVQ